MKEIEEIYENFKNGKLNEKEASLKLIEIIFLRKREFGLSKLDEDSLSDFLIYELTHLEKIFKIYKENAGSFSNFLYGNVNISLTYYNRKKALQKTKAEYVSQICEEYYSENEYNYSLSEIEQKRLSETDCTSEEIEKLKEILQKSRLIFRNPKKLKLALKILVIKSCYFLTEDLINKTAILIEIKKEDLYTLIEKGIGEIKSKLGRIESMMQKRDNAYFYRNRYMLQRCRYSEEPSWLKVVNKKYAIQNQRWEASINELSESKQNLCPSNVSVAKILGIDERSVAYIIKKLDANIDSFLLPCYSLTHEILPCKQ